MNYNNYLAGGGSPYENTMARAEQPVAQPKMMGMEEWLAFLKALTPEQLAEVQAQGINWGGGESGPGIQWGKQDKGGGNPLEKLMGMFGGKGKSAEGG